MNSLGLDRARLIDLNQRRTATLGLASQNNAPKLAIIVESDVALVVSTVRALKRRWSKIKVLVHGLPNQEKPILRALGCGADGIVLAEEPLDALAQATRDVLADKFRPPPELIRPLFDRLLRFRGSGGAEPSLLAQLSTRESEILNLLQRGEGNKAIACQLNLEVQTIKNHVTHILRKLGVQSRYDAVRVAGKLERGR